MYPKVLVINAEPFWQGSATGLTMSRLFKGWPSDKLACLYTTEIIPDLTSCDKYWKLTAKNLRCVSNLMGPNYMKSEVNRNTDEITTIKEEEQEK